MTRVAQLEDFGTDAYVGGVSGLIAAVGRAHRHAADDLLRDIGLHPGQVFVVQHLQDETLSQRELSQRLCVEAPTVTRMLQRMEQAGLIERCTDVRDARVTRVRLTERGLALRQSVNEFWAAIEEQTVAGMSRAEVDQLRRLLAKVRDNLSHADAA